MGNAITVEIKGLRELQDALRELPEKIAGLVLNGAVKEGAQVIEREAELRAPERTGALRRSIVATALKRPHEGHDATVIVRVRRSTKTQRLKRQKAGQPVDDAFYWRFVEFGTSKASARPFLRPAFEAKKAEAAGVIKQALRRRIEKEAAKLRKWTR